MTTIKIEGENCQEEKRGKKHMAGFIVEEHFRYFFPWFECLMDQFPL